MNMNYITLIGYRQVDANLKKVYEEDETGQKENIYYRTAENSCQKYVFGRMYGECPVVSSWGTKIRYLDILSDVYSAFKIL